MKKKLLILIPILIIIIVFIIKSFFIVNKTLYPNPKVVGDGNIKIACVGDSITYGLGVIDNRNYAWTSLLVKELGSNYQTINYGLISRTLSDSGDMPYMKEKLAKEFWNNDYDIILFMLGTNDTKKINWNEDEFRKDYDKIIKRLVKEKNNSKIYIMIPPEIYINNPTEFEPNRVNLENGVVPIIKDITSKYNNIEVIDLYTYTIDHKEWFNDGLHPNREGNKEIAKEIANNIKG